jgi:Glycogen recognition site of AMP-activated protein kinase
VSRRTAGLSFVACFAGSLVSTVSAQGIALDLSAGQIVYQPLPAEVATNNAAATLRYDSPRGVWLYGTAAMPFGGTDSRWGGFGIGDRLVRSTSSSERVNIGADIGAHGFVFHDAVLDQGGSGGFVEAMPFLHVPAGLATFEVGGGWRGQTLSYVGTVDARHVFESRAHVTYGPAEAGAHRQSTGWILEGEARWVRASEGLYPFLGGGLRYQGSPVQAWLQTGKWFSSSLDDASWGAGISVTLTTRLALWSSVRQDAPDPLYWNLPRRSWSVGITRRFNTVGLAPVATTQTEAGGVLIRVNAADVDGASVSVAGDFNGWRPVPMQREGREWVARLQLAPGVYHYAFRSDRAEWFVPASVPGRRDDGMGGYVAVLVVS